MKTEPALYNTRGRFLPRVDGHYTDITRTLGGYKVGINRI